MKTEEHQDPSPLETDIRESLLLYNTSTLGLKPSALETTLPPDPAPMSIVPSLHQVRTFSPHSRVASVDTTLIPASFPTVKKGKVIRPDSEIKQWWDVGYDVAVLYSLCTTMYYLAYEYPGRGMYAVDVCVWVFFVADVFVTSNTAFFSPDHYIITSRKLIFLRYAQSWLLPDVIALLPFSFDGFSAVEYYLRLIRFLRLPRCLTFGDGQGLGRVFGLMVAHLPEIKFGDFRVSYYYLTLMCQQVVRMVALSYFLACIFYWYAKHTGPEHVYGSEWFDDSAHLTGEPGSIKFLHSWYFMLTTLMTIGYGDYLPVSFCEQLLMIAFLILGIANFSLIMGSFVSLISDLNELNSSSSLHTQASLWLDSLESAGHQVPKDLKTRVVEYFEQYGEKDRLGTLAGVWWQAEGTEDLGRAGDATFESLLDGEKRAILSHLFGDVYLWYRSLLGVGRCSFAYDISFHFQPRVYPPSSLILEELSEVDEITLVLKGDLSCEFTHQSSPHPFLTFSNRLSIGTYSVLTGTKAKTSYRAVGLSGIQAIAVPKRPFLDLLEGKYGEKDEKGYCHKAEILQKAAVVEKTVETAKKDYMKKKGIEAKPVFSQMAIKVTSKLIKLGEIDSAAYQYESTVSLTIENISFRHVYVHKFPHFPLQRPNPSEKRPKRPTFRY